MNTEGAVVRQESGDAPSATDRRAATDRRTNRERRSGWDARRGDHAWAGFGTGDAPRDTSKPYRFRAFVDRRSGADRREAVDKQAVLDLAITFYLSAMEETVLRRRFLSRDEIEALLDGT